MSISEVACTECPKSSARARARTHGGFSESSLRPSQSSWSGSVASSSATAPKGRRRPSHRSGGGLVRNRNRKLTIRAVKLSQVLRWPAGPFGCYESADISPESGSVRVTVVPLPRLLKAQACSSSVIPMPVSVISHLMVSPSLPVRMVTAPPSGVYLMAFESRLSMT